MLPNKALESIRVSGFNWFLASSTTCLAKSMASLWFEVGAQISFFGPPSSCLFSSCQRCLIPLDICGSENEWEEEGESENFAGTSWGVLTRSFLLGLSVHDSRELSYRLWQAICILLTPVGIFWCTISGDSWHLCHWLFSLLSKALELLFDLWEDVLYSSFAVLSTFSTLLDLRLPCLSALDGDSFPSSFDLSCLLVLDDWDGMDSWSSPSPLT